MSPKTPAGYRPDITQSREVPGSGSIMASWDRIMKSRGLDQASETEAAMQEQFDEWAKEQVRQGLPVSATEFNKYLTASAAYALHQGKGGKTQADAIARASGGKRAPAPRSTRDINIQTRPPNQQIYRP
jgi:hypothetical protein